MASNQEANYNQNANARNFDEDDNVDPNQN